MKTEADIEAENAYEVVQTFFTQSLKLAPDDLNGQMSALGATATLVMRVTAAAWATSLEKEGDLECARELLDMIKSRVLESLSDEGWK